MADQEKTFNQVARARKYGRFVENECVSWSWDKYPTVRRLVTDQGQEIGLVEGNSDTQFRAQVVIEGTFRTLAEVREWASNLLYADNELRE